MSCNSNRSDKNMMVMVMEMYRQHDNKGYEDDDDGWENASIARENGLVGLFHMWLLQ